LFRGDFASQLRPSWGALKYFHFGKGTYFDRENEYLSTAKYFAKPFVKSVEVWQAFVFIFIP
jgi:hypothetical protein